jgi:DNA-binding MarR family transcriptional regulator
MKARKAGKASEAGKPVEAAKSTVKMGEPNAIPAEVVKQSVLVNLAMAYLSVTKQMERKTQCSQTRGFILATLRGGAALNQNQIANLLGFDRTVVHRSIKVMLREGLVAERPAESGRALLVSLTAKGTKYREYLIGERRAADENVQRRLKPRERAMLIRLLKVVAEVEL